MLRPRARPRPRAGISDLVLLTDRDVPACEFYRAHGFREGTSQVFMIG